MDIFLLLTLKLIPLYAIMAAGYLVTRYAKVDQRSIAPYLVYIILPVVVFDTAYRIEFTLSTVSLPLIIWMASAIIGLVWFLMARMVWSDGKHHIAGFGAGGSNFGYFGVPAAIALFGEEVRSIAILFMLAYLLFENTIGYMLIYPKKLPLPVLASKIFRLPAFYTLILGVLVNLSGITLPAFYSDFVGNVYGAFVILGSLLVGIGFAHFHKSNLHLGFLAFMLVAKFVVWPLAAMALIWIDTTWFQLYSPTIYRIIFLMSLVPVAANTVTYAALLKIKPGEASLVVIVSTLLSLVYIPLMLTLTGE
jgi:predicted permease